jgi:hypothetical protein
LGVGLITPHRKKEACYETINLASDLDGFFGRTFLPKRDGVTAGCRKLHSEELHNLCSSRNVIRIIKSRKMRWAGHVARMGEKRNVYRLLVGKPEGKRPLERPRRKWIDNVNMDILEIGLSGVDWIGMAQDRYRRRGTVNAIMNLRVP